MLEGSVGKGKRGCYVKLLPNVNDGYQALLEMAAPRQWLHPRIFINVVSTHHCFNTKLAHRHCTFVWVWVWLVDTQYGHRFVIVKLQKIFTNFLLAASPQKFYPTKISRRTVINHTEVTFANFVSFGENLNKLHTTVALLISFNKLSS